jgi:FkbH-like protein
MSHIAPQPLRSAAPLKCVVWDLDDTLWDGILAEDARVSLRDEAADTIRALDACGVLNSIASRNSAEDALRQLRAFELDAYFLAPQINWGSKVVSIQKIAETLSIRLDALAFVDDDPVERAEVGSVLPEVRTVAAGEEHKLLAGDLGPVGTVTEESRSRRQMYVADAQRKADEAIFAGSREAFLAELDLRFNIAPAEHGDLPRAAELTLRTNQLNATGRAYSIDELDWVRRSPDHDLLIAGLSDRYGSYGKIGLALVERTPSVWTIKMLLVSCRAISKGVGPILLAHVIGSARRARVRLRAEFIDSGRNRGLYILYRFAGFHEVWREGSMAVLEANPSVQLAVPDYVALEVLG